MATKAKELKDGCLSRAADDEPVFVLRAKDIVAPAAVRGWCELAAVAGAGEAKLMEAIQVAEDMMAWQKENGFKVPD